MTIANSVVDSAVNDGARISCEVTTVSNGN